MTDYPSGYDRIAVEYGKRFYHELDDKPADREMLDRFARAVAGKGPVCDLGCGPGEIAHYLYDQGLHSVFGMDLSAGMVAEARRLDPRIPFQQGDMLKIQAPDHAWAGIAAFYAIVHFPIERIPRALGEMARVLQPDGKLLLTFHIGNEMIHVDEMFGISVSLDYYFFQPDEIRGLLEEVGFEIEELIVRDPYPGVEYPSRRAYIFARKCDEPNLSGQELVD